MIAGNLRIKPVAYLAVAVAAGDVTDAAMTDVGPEEVERAPPDDGGSDVTMTSPTRDLVSPHDLAIKVEVMDAGLDVDAAEERSGTLADGEGALSGSCPEHDASTTTERPGGVDERPAEQNHDAGGGQNDFPFDAASAAAAAAAVVLSSSSGTSSVAAMDQALTAAALGTNQVDYCRVCGDEATGMYFGALVCVPCKVRSSKPSTFHSLHLTIVLRRR